MTLSVRHGAPWALLSAAVAALVIAGCAPEDYPREVEADSTHAVTGGSDPTAMSGRSPADSVATDHHPQADGNSGRPAARPGTLTEAGGTGKR